MQLEIREPLVQLLCADWRQVVMEERLHQLPVPQEVL
jgi:hypothetical protein